MNEVSLYVAAANAFWFAGISAHGPTIAIIQSCSSCKSCPDSGGSVTLCSDLPGLDPTVTQKIYFEMKMYAGYQHLYTVVYDEDGELVATVYPAQGLRETTWIETSCAGGRLRGVAETVEQPTLAVDVRLEDGQPGMSSAEAGYYYSIDGAFRKYYSVEVPSYTQTELIAIQALELPGFVFVRWEGNGVALDSEGNVREDVTLSPFVGAGQPYTERLIYVKCQDSWLAPTSRELTAVFRPCTHCGWRTASEAPAAERGDGVVGRLLGDTCLPDGLGYYKKAGTDDFYGCRWYIHTNIMVAGSLWWLSGMPARIGIVGISRQGGGSNGISRSHQNGCDVDIRYVRNDDQEAALDLALPNDRPFFDRAKTKHLINLMKLSGAELIFIAPETQIQEDAVVKHWSGHTHHMHVRFPDPDGGQAATCPPCPVEYK